MTQVRVSCRMKASPEVIFRAVSDFEKLPETNPDVVRVEFLTDQRSGAGTQIRETRRMGKQDHVTELEVTEFDENRRMRMVADSHGTVWDTLFRVEPQGEETELELIMDARGHKLKNRIMNRIFKGMYRRGMAKHLEEVKSYCEAQMG